MRTINNFSIYFKVRVREGNTYGPKTVLVNFRSATHLALAQPVLNTILLSATLESNGLTATQLEQNTETRNRLKIFSSLFVFHIFLKLKD